jgi:hypothetical protein
MGAGEVDADDDGKTQSMADQSISTTNILIEMEQKAATKLRKM